MNIFIEYLSESIFQRSAKNELHTQTQELWRARKPSIFIPQGELCPPEDAIFAEARLRAGSDKSLPCGLCARKTPQSF